MTPKEKLEHLKESLGRDERVILTDILTSARHAAYDAGYKDGLEPFAYWHDGKQVCGGSRVSLVQAQATRFNLYNYKPEQVDLLPEHMPAMAESMK